MCASRLHSDTNQWQARRKRARGRESGAVIIDQEDGNSTESIPIGWEEGVRDRGVGGTQGEGAATGREGWRRQG